MKINVAAIFVGNKFEDKYQGSKFPKYTYKVDYDYYPEGYIIHNLDFNDIDISKVDSEKKVIKPGEKFYLTTDKIIFLLFDNKQKLEIENGKFKYYPIHNDQDILFDFYFEPSSEFSDYFRLHDKSSLAIYLSNKSTLFNPLSFIWFLKGDKDHHKVQDVFYIRGSYTYIADVSDWLNNNCLGPSNYNRFCSGITTALTDHLNIKHELKNNKIKSKKSDEIIEYYGEVISNPVEFNVPNAIGDIKLNLTKTYDMTNLSNCNFGNLNIDLSCDIFSELVKIKTLGKIERIHDSNIMRNVEVDSLYKCKLFERFDVKARDIYNCSGRINNLSLIDNEDCSEVYIHSTPTASKDCELYIKNLNLGKKTLRLRDYDYNFSHTFLTIENLFIDIDKYEYNIIIDNDGSMATNTNHIKILIKNIINTNTTDKSLSFLLNSRCAYIIIESVKNIDEIKFNSAKRAKLNILDKTERELFWKRFNASLAIPNNR